MIVKKFDEKKEYRNIKWINRFYNFYFYIWLLSNVYIVFYLFTVNSLAGLIVFLLAYFLTLAILFGHRYFITNFHLAFYKIYDASILIEKFLTERNDEHLRKARSKLLDAVDFYERTLGPFYSEEDPINRIIRYFDFRIKIFNYWLKIYSFKIAEIRRIKSKLEILAVEVYNKNYYNVFKIVNSFPYLYRPMKRINNVEDLYKKEKIKELEEELCIFSGWKKYRKRIEGLFSASAKMKEGIIVWILIIIVGYLIFTGNLDKIISMILSKLV